MLRGSSIIKEEDQVFSFVVHLNGKNEITPESLDYVVENLKKLESKKKKKATELNVEDALDARVKLLRSLCFLFQTLHAKIIDLANL